MIREDHDLVWLLTLSLPGVELRASSRPITLAGANSAPIEYPGGLSGIEYAEQVDLLSVAPASQTVAVECYLSPTPATLASRGIDLREGTATLSYILAPPANREPASIAAADAVTVAVGRPSTPAWGDPLKPAEWCAFSLDATPYTSEAPLLDARSVMSTGIFPNMNENAVGMAFPMIIGQPGNGPVVVFSTPAYVLSEIGPDAYALLIAGYDAKAGANVVISDGDASEGFAVESFVAPNGQPYFRVDVSSASVINRRAGAYFARWTASSGVAAASRGASRANVASALLYLLNRAGAQVDIVNSKPALDRLRSLDFNVYLNDLEATAWEYASDQVIPYLPVVIRRGSNGLILKYVDHDVPAHLTTQISLADGIVRLDPVIFEDPKEPLYLTLTGGQNLITGGASVVANFDPTAPAGAGPSYTLARTGIATRVAQTLAGAPVTPRTQQIYLPWADTQSTLFTLGLHYLALRGSRALSVTYSAPPRYAHVEPGDAVAVTDPAIGWVDRVLWVRSKNWRSGRWIWSLWGIDRPAHA